MTRGWVQASFWIGIAAALTLAVHLLGAILLPFVLGAAIAFVLNPLVEQLVAWKAPRTLAVVAALTAFILCIVLIFVLLVPLLSVQLAQLMHRIPAYVAAGRQQLDSAFQFLQARLSPDDLQRLRDAAGAKAAELLGGVGDLVSKVLTGGLAVANLLSLVFVTPIVAFFLLRDWNGIIDAIDAWLPRRHAAVIRAQAALIHETLSGFVRGQASVCLLMGAFYAVGLTILGIEGGAVVGFCVGALLFIPFLGGLTGATISVLLAAAEYGLWQKPIWVAVLFAIGQSLETNVISPKLVGDRVHLHALWIIFSLFAFGELFGFLGVLIAVPMAAVMGVLVRFALQQYLASPLYDPAPHPPPDAAA